MTTTTTRTEARDLRIEPAHHPRIAELLKVAEEVATAMLAADEVMAGPNDRALRRTWERADQIGAPERVRPARTWADIVARAIVERTRIDRDDDYELENAVLAAAGIVHPFDTMDGAVRQAA